MCPGAPSPRLSRTSAFSDFRVGLGKLPPRTCPIPLVFSLFSSQHLQARSTFASPLRDFLTPSSLILYCVSNALILIRSCVAVNTMTGSASEGELYMWDDLGPMYDMESWRKRSGRQEREYQPTST